MASAEGGSLVDSVTLVQQEIAATCSALFNYIGSLQRDAPPASVNGEALVGPSLSGFDVDAQVEFMGSDLAARLVALRRAIESLPQQEDPAALEARAVELQALNAEAARELAGAASEARARLGQIRSLHAVVADALLDSQGGLP